MNAKNNPEKEKKHRSGLGRIRPGSDLFSEDTLVLRGEDAAVVYGCKRILLYERARICLSLGSRQITLMGDDLICTAFTAGTVTVEGKIHGAAYCTEQCAGECRKKEGREKQ